MIQDRATVTMERQYYYYFFLPSVDIFPRGIYIIIIFYFIFFIFLLLLLLLLLLNEYYLHAVKQKSCKSMLQKTHNAICQIVPFPMAFNDP